jgi:hypothetical protein
MNPVISPDALLLLEAAVVDSSNNTVKLFPPKTAFNILAFQEVARLLTDSGSTYDSKHSRHQFETDPAPIIADLIARAKNQSIEPEPTSISARHYKGVEIALETFEIHAKYDGEWKSVSESGLEKSSVFKAGGVWRVRVGATTSAQKHAQRAEAALELLKLAGCLDDVTDLEIAWDDGVGSQLIALPLEQPIESQEPVVEVAQTENTLDAAPELEETLPDLDEEYPPEVSPTDTLGLEHFPPNQPVTVQLLRDGNNEIEVKPNGLTLGSLVFLEESNCWNSRLKDNLKLDDYNTNVLDIALSWFLGLKDDDSVQVKFVSDAGVITQGTLNIALGFVLTDGTIANLGQLLFGFVHGVKSVETESVQPAPEKAKRTRKPRAAQTEVSEPVQAIAEALPPTTDIGLEDAFTVWQCPACGSQFNQPHDSCPTGCQTNEGLVKIPVPEGNWETVADSFVETKLEQIKQFFVERNEIDSALSDLAILEESDRNLPGAKAVIDEVNDWLDTRQSARVLPLEILAMLKLEETLKDLNLHARERVLDWAFAKLVKHVPAV